MTERHSLYRLATICLAAFVSQISSVSEAQLIRAPLTDGFARTSSIDVSVDEMLGFRKVRKPEEAILGPGYPALQMLEIQYKPVRMVRMPVTDPKTGKVSRELVWYMVYRTIPRDYTELAGDGQAELLVKLSDPEHDPANSTDPKQVQPLMLPRFILRVDDKGSEKEHLDELNLQIQQMVFEREFGRRGADLRLHNSVDGIQSYPDPVRTLGPDADAKPLDKATYGVAIWRNIDPKTDYFTVFMSGLSNAYRISTDAAGARVVEEKVVKQQFARPGDEFLQDEKEFRIEEKPEWLYRAKNVQLDVPQVDTILRNAQKSAETAEQ
ncbi:MAG: hypothetical protein KDA91_13545 [Planctomycetaceae bacterium]|nr:hypothetical protein [Planctomycetaceae bacterium]